MRPLALAFPPSLLPPSHPPYLLSCLSPSLSPSIPAFLSPFLFALLGYKVIKKSPPLRPAQYTWKGQTVDF